MLNNNVGTIGNEWGQYNNYDMACTIGYCSLYLIEKPSNIAIAMIKLLGILYLRPLCIITIPLLSICDRNMVSLFLFSLPIAFD